MTLLATVGVFALVVVGVAAQGSAVPPDVPENLRVPAGEKVFLHAHAKGV